MRKAAIADPVLVGVPLPGSLCDEFNLLLTNLSDPTIGKQEKLHTASPLFTSLQTVWAEFNNLGLAASCSLQIHKVSNQNVLNT